MRRLLTFLSILLTTGALAAGAAGIYGLGRYSAPGPLQQEKFLIVEKGQGVSTIAARLEDENIIDSALLFKIMTRISGHHTALKAGEYRFEPGVSMQAVLEKLESGDIYQRRFTVPEGLTSWQIVQILKDVDDLEGGIEDIPAEGSLLPETYNYRLGETRAGKIAQMQQAMEDAIADVVANKPENAADLTQAELVTLASIVEKETAVASERRRIAGVFHNRLEIGMPLQTDPTVIYAITEGEIEDKGMGPLGRRLLTKDLQYDSPYNTYKYPGLPPGPIANPGRAALEAAINPEDHDYLYFVADGTGGHVFSKTLDEHNRNVAKWRKIRRAQGN